MYVFVFAGILLICGVIASGFETDEAQTVAAGLYRTALVIILLGTLFVLS